MFEVDKRGVWRVQYGSTGDATRQLVCGPLEIANRVRTARGERWGWLVRWCDDEGRKHETVLNSEDTAGEASQFVRPMLERGLFIAPNAAKYVLAFVSSQRHAPLATRVLRPGWTDNGAVYIDPTGRAYGHEGAEHYVFTPGDGVSEFVGQRGTLASWKENVARLCEGNTRYIFAVSSVLASALMRDAKVDGGGFHFVGESSQGKSRFLWAAQSVVGPREGVASWESTRNAFGEMAMAHNDAPLILDEIGNADPRVVGSAVYTLANGIDKARMQKDGGLRAPRRWRTLLLSAGERDIESMIKEGGQTAKAGQTARLANIPAETGTPFGVFDTLHGRPDGAVLARDFDVVTREYYGTAWPTWLQWLTGIAPDERTAMIRERADLFRTRALSLMRSPSGEVHRVLDRFALVATAGELATAAGITGWPVGAAQAATEVCLLAWIERRGGAGSSDRARLFAHVRRLFTEQEGSFEVRQVVGTELKPVPGSFGEPVALRGTRLGYLAKSGGRAFVHGETFKAHFAADFAPSPKVAVRWLVEAGWIVNQGPDGGRKCFVDGQRPRLLEFDLTAMHADVDA
jgi:putative DNA primase/helicase